MPNMKGGSGYKRKKKGGGEEEAIIIADMADDQMFGRIIKVLGNCNLLVYCEDNRERICHIRGKMRSRTFVHTGDIVIISTREFEKDNKGKIPRGDICHKYDTKHHSALRKKFPDLNPLMFAAVDTKNGTIMDDGDFDIFETNEDIAPTLNENSQEDNYDSDFDADSHSLSQNKVVNNKVVNSENYENINYEDINIDDI